MRRLRGRGAYNLSWWREREGEGRGKGSRNVLGHLTQCCLIRRRDRRLTEVIFARAEQDIRTSENSIEHTTAANCMSVGEEKRKVSALGKEKVRIPKFQ